VASILAIFASFFLFGFHNIHSSPLVIIYILLVGCLVTNFIAAATADPGIVDKPRHVKIRAIVDLAKRGRLADADICTTCLIEKPPRSKHDPTLGKCVKRFDHFCPYVANVVGQNNYLYFFLFLFFVVITLTLHAVLVFPHLQIVDCARNLSSKKTRRTTSYHSGSRFLIARRDHHSGSDQGDKYICLLKPENALISVATFFACIHLIWVFALLAVHFSLVCSDQTTYESIRHTYSSHRYHGGTSGSSHSHASHDDDAVKIDSVCCAAKIRNTQSALCAVEGRHTPDDNHQHNIV